jgi:hypothetical protein
MNIVNANWSAPKTDIASDLRAAAKLVAEQTGGVVQPNYNCPLCGVHMSKWSHFRHCPSLQGDEAVINAVFGSREAMEEWFSED